MYLEEVYFLDIINICIKKLFSSTLYSILKFIFKTCNQTVYLFYTFYKNELNKLKFLSFFDFIESSGIAFTFIFLMKRSN